MRIGVYVCHCGKNIADMVDVAQVAEFARGLAHVVVARDYVYLCSDPGLELIRNDILQFQLDHVVIASCSPLMHQLTFMDNVQRAGLNPYCLERANIREQCSWVHSDRRIATRKAKKLVAAAVVKVALAQPLEVEEVELNPSVLIIGGGIAGIEAAIELGGMDIEVFLVEKEPQLGGHVAQLYRTFPNLADARELLRARLEKLDSNPKIEVLTCAEVKEIEGYVGNFRAKVRQEATYVDQERCNRCGLCSQACPVRVPDEFDVGLRQRAAIYPSRFPKPYYLIDPKACLSLQGQGCSACADACQPGAIDLHQEAHERELEIGAIIVATGYKTFDPHFKPEYGYGVYKNVITGLELERLASPFGPTRGKIQINGQEPENVVFIHCVGSRDKTVGREYCSRVCCMYTAKQAHYIKEKIPQARVTVCYTDIRAYGKGYEQFYERVQKEGVIYRRGMVSEIYRRGEKLVVRAEDTLLGEFFEEEADLVVLATGIVPQREAPELARKLKVHLDGDGFFLEAHPKLGPVETATEGIFLAGCCQGPKDITEAATQGRAAAAKAASLLFQRTLRKEPLVPWIDPEICRGCRLCETVCEFGALFFDERRGVVSVNELLCRGCGACAIACPSGANQVRNFTKRQILEMTSVLI